MAYILFTTPFRTERLTDSEKRLADRADEKLRSAKDIGFTQDRKSVAAYSFGEKQNANSKTILLVHGWMSAARYMLAMVDPLVVAGHKVVCIDLPAHGASEGIRTDLVQCAKALEQLIENLGTVDIVVAHSFGGAVTAYTLSRCQHRALEPYGQIVLLASPNRLSSVTRDFAKALGLSQKAKKTYESLLCRKIGSTLDEMDGNVMFAQAGYPLKIIHCVDDEEVSIDESRRYLKSKVDTQLTELSGLGHRRILYHSDAIGALTEAINANES